MAVEVGISVVDSDSNPIDDVTVVFYDRTTLAVITSTLTGSDGAGRGSASLPGSPSGISYLVRLYLLSHTSLYAPPIQFEEKKQIQVFDPPLPEFNDENEFVFVRPEDPEYGATDSDLCRCHLFATHLDKKPLKDFVLFIRQAFDPETFHGGAVPYNGGVVAADRKSVVTDETGKAAIDLFRGGRYYAWTASRAEDTVLFEVPDTAYADIVDLIWLYPKTFAFAETTLSIPADETYLLDVSTFKMSNGKSVDMEGTEYSPSQFLQLVSSDEGVFTAVWEDEQIRITPVGSGTATLTVALLDYRENNTALRLPQPTITHTPVSITVT